MSDLLARLRAWFRGNDSGRRRACYGLTVTFLSMLVFCVLVATVGYWKAFVFAGLVLAAFTLAECLVPESWRVEQQRSAEHQATAGAAGVPRPACRFGLAKARIDALPTFAYSPSGTEGSADLESGTDKLCSVCLEDLEDGEMVRQLPTCKHLFHVECIDMWLHSHTTCPVCRCDLSPPRTIATKVPPAVDREQPTTHDALPPV
uniref:Uncharacterized protein n=1 Tax=Avena sativa TaxID=4498 RepID=A0ACD5YQ95_AVESA